MDDLDLELPSPSQSPPKPWREVDELVQPLATLVPPPNFVEHWNLEKLPPCSAEKAWNNLLTAEMRAGWVTGPDTEPAPRETHPSRVRPLEDNVLLYLKPRPTRMAGSLIELPQNRAGRPTGAREGIVLATGPGWRLRGGRGPLVPTEVEPGQCVVVDAKAGQDWALDVAKPRTNPRGCSWESFPVPTELERVGGEYRMVRADEILFELPDQRPEDEALELDYGELGRR